MQKTIYTHTPTGQSWDYRLPKILRYDGKSIMGITDANMAQFGITKTTVDIPEAPPEGEPADTVRYSKLAIKRALDAAGLWDGVKAAVVDAGKWDDLLLAQDLADGDPDFVAMRGVIEAAYGIDAESILQSCRI